MDILPPREPVTIVIVGHVDHGKSTFIGRFLFDTNNLTSDKVQDLEATAKESGKKLEFAHVMDQFREEREQNITIDTAQTFFNLGVQPYIFVDAPGHKEYLKNMITGATQAENALLLLDVKEGIREQTEKHAQILKLLGITNLAVLVNKMDLVDYSEARFQELTSQLNTLLAQHGIQPAHVIPVSAYEGENVARASEKMSWYHGPTVLGFIESIATKTEVQETGTPAFAVQMLYNVDGEAYVLGRVEKGSFKKGDDTFIFPTQTPAKIKGIFKYKEKLKQAASGDSVALVLDRDAGLKRGSILCGKEKGENVARFRSHSFWAFPTPLKVKDKLVLECRTQSAPCVVSGIRDAFDSSSLDSLAPGDIGLVDFEVSAPLFIQNQGVADPFSRVVLHKGGDIVGCAVVEKVN